MAKRRGHGEGSVTGGNGRWVIRVTTGTAGGKQTRVKRTVRGTKRDAHGCPEGPPG